MGLLRDFFMGYAHGSSKARDARIEKKVDDLSDKVNSMNSPNSYSPPINPPKNKMAITGLDGKTKYVDAPYQRAQKDLNYSTHQFFQRKANEALAKGDMEEYRQVNVDMKEFDKNNPRF